MPNTICILTIIAWWIGLFGGLLHAQERPHDPLAGGNALSLEQCIEIALERNQQRKISALAVQIARHQYQQAVSAYWPGLMANAMATRLDDNPVLVMPEESAGFQIGELSTPDVTIPGVGTVPGRIIPPQETTVTIPERTIPLMDRDSLVTSVNMTYMLYAGGERSAILEQLQSNTDAAREAVRRTDLQLICDVKRMYYGVILSAKLHQIASDALSRLKATTELTEQLYRNGSGSVKKTDYLKSRTMAESARAIAASFAGNREISRAALVNTLGLSWDTDIQLSETEIPFRPQQVALEELIGDVYAFNPDWKQFQAILEAARAGIDREKSGHMPKLMLTGMLWRIDNQYDYGMVNDDNRDGWKIGLGLRLPLFQGFLTHEKIQEAKAYAKKLEGRKILLRQGIALQVKHAFLRMNSCYKQAVATREAVRSARENRELSERAYAAGLVDTKEVIESQILESIMDARFHHIRFQHAENRFLLEKLVGHAIEQHWKGHSDDS